MSDVMLWMVRQMQNAVQPEPEREQFNPRPPGVMRNGGGPRAVLMFLEANPNNCYVHHEIVAATGRTKTSVDWGLLFLRRQRLIECFPDARNSRYWMYRVRRERVKDKDWPWHE